MLGLQTPQVLVALFVDLEVRLEIFPQSIHQQLLPVQTPISPATELIHRPEGGREMLK